MRICPRDIAGGQGRWPTISPERTQSDHTHRLLGKAELEDVINHVVHISQYFCHGVVQRFITVGLGNSSTEVNYGVLGEENLFKSESLLKGDVENSHPMLK